MIEDSSDLQPAPIPGYAGGPYTRRPDLLDEPLFWLGHLYDCARTEQAEELLFGPDDEAAQAFHCRLWDAGDWPVFTVPLGAGHLLHVVHRTLTDDQGTDYLLHHPDWDRAELLVREDGCYLGPGLSWAELLTAAYGAEAGGCSDDPHVRLLLLLPALGDDDLPVDASATLAAALAARTAVADPVLLASLLLAEQGRPELVHWRTDADGTRVNDGRYSRRNPDNPFALPPSRLARVSAVLAP